MQQGAQQGQGATGPGAMGMGCSGAHGGLGCRCTGVWEQWGAQQGQGARESGYSGDGVQQGAEAESGCSREWGAAWVQGCGCNGGRVQSSQGARGWGGCSGLRLQRGWGAQRGQAKADPNFSPPPPGGGDGDVPCGQGGLRGPYPDKVNKGVVDVGTAGQEKATSGAELVEEEKLLILQWFGGRVGVTGGLLVIPQ